jgi:hypothetical protein
VKLLFESLPFFPRLALVDLRNITLGPQYFDWLSALRDPLEHLHLVGCVYHADMPLLGAIRARRVTVNMGYSPELIRAVTATFLSDRWLKEVTLVTTWVHEAVDALRIYPAAIASITVLRLVPKLQEDDFRNHRLTVPQIHDLTKLLEVCPKLKELHIGCNLVALAVEDMKLPRATLPKLRMLSCGMLDFGYFSDTVGAVRKLHMGLPKWITRLDNMVTTITLLKLVSSNQSFFSQLAFLSLSIKSDGNVIRLFECLPDGCPQLRIFNLLCLTPEYRVSRVYSSLHRSPELY